jgi:hypothetical protein
VILVLTAAVVVDIVGELNLCRVYATDRVTEEYELNSQRERGNYLLSMTSRPTLGTNPAFHNDGYREMLPRGLSGKSIKLTTHLHVVELYLRSPTRLHTIVPS